jgi:hypothetical protein
MNRMLAIVMFVTHASFAAEPTFAESLSAVIPKENEEAWMKIPWKTNIAKARVEAQLQGKPIFLWIMNGNPLGCT